MTRLSGDLAQDDLREVVRSLFLGRATGVLEAVVESGKRRLFFIDGQLFLPPSNPLATQVSQQLQGEQSPDVIADLMMRMAAVIRGWRTGTYSFDPGRAAVPPDAVGPLPTAQLVVAAMLQDRDDEALLQRLGGEGGRWVSRPASEGQLRDFTLEPTERELWEELAEPASVLTLLQRSLDRRSMLLHLNRLEALRLIERHEARVRAELLVDGDVVGRFAERVAQGLHARPIDVSPALHRARLAELLGQLGELSHYQLLGIDADASVEQVHAAYNELARLVHPIHAAQLGLAGREDAMRLLFERATEAYLVLADPDRRRRYNRETGVIQPLAPGAAKGEPQPSSPEVAEKLYGQARDMVERNEFHYAIELLRKAIQAQPKADYYVLLSEVQQKNPNWLQHASDSMREAVHLAPHMLEYRRQLAALYDRLGDHARARAVWRSILSRAPRDPDALRAMERLGDPTKKKKGFLQSLFS